ncbi:MAG: response regulator [Thermodesulfobacteriota bacterium]
MAGHYSIVLADAHERFRRELRKMLEQHPDIQVLGEAGNHHELFKFLRQSLPAMVILDIALPHIRVREGTRLIKLQYPEVKVLITVMDNEPEYLYHGLAAGAEGVLPKQYVAGQIFQAIALIRQGRVYAPPGISLDSRLSAKRFSWAGMFGPSHC